MRETLNRILLRILLVLSASGCVEPYQANINTSELNTLVVDGFYNSTDGTVTVTLSRSRPIGDNTPRPEKGATVFVEEEGGKSVKVFEAAAGTYSATGISLASSKRCRIRMIAKSREYYSDFVTIQQTPAIDTVVWKPLSDGVGILVSTHGPGTTGYYRWTYEETWRYHAYYQSYFTFKDHAAVYRTEDEQIWECYTTQPSTKISAASTTQLAENRINEYELVFLPQDSRKISSRYSILVKQMSITPEAYEYWRQLQKTTENLGGLFDPLPGQITGNIHCKTNPPEVVVGYFSASGVTQQRIFLDYNELPPYLRSTGFRGKCEEGDMLPLEMVKTLEGAYNLTSAIYGANEKIVGYHFSSFDCTDCRLEGGTVNKPSWWK